MTMVDGVETILHVCNEVQSKIPKVFKTPIRRLAKVAEAAWTGAPTIILNRPSKSGAGAEAGILVTDKGYHERVQEMRTIWSYRTSEIAFRETRPVNLIVSTKGLLLFQLLRVIQVVKSTQGGHDRGG